MAKAKKKKRMTHRILYQLRVMPNHPCLDEPTWGWGWDAACLGMTLDAALAANGNQAGWAWMLQSQADFTALVTVRNQIEYARGFEVWRPPEWFVAGVLVVPGLEAQANAVTQGLEHDRLDTAYPGFHVKGVAGWLATGMPQTGAEGVLDWLYGKVKNALDP